MLTIAADRNYNYFRGQKWLAAMTTHIVTELDLCFFPKGQQNGMHYIIEVHPQMS